MTQPLSIRQRLIAGARAQAVSNGIRVLVQIGTVAVLVPAWGLQLYGEWLVIGAIPTYLALSDLGFFTAASSDMMMSVGRGERDLARDVFQTVSRAVAIVFVVLAVLLPVIAAVVPLTLWLNFTKINETTAGAAFVLLGLRTVLISYAGLLYGGFAAAGHYGEGIMVRSAIVFAEFVALIVAAVLGYGPATAAGAMLVVRVCGNSAMYVAMRRRAPWLRFGRPRGKPRVLKRLTGPSLASAAIGTGATLNIQGMVVLIGVVTGPASAAIFTTVRTLSRAVIQLLDAISEIVAPELAKAYGEANAELLRRLNRRASHVAFWTALPILGVLGIFGGTILDLWTGGAIKSGGTLLYLLLLAAGIDALWYTTGAILFWTNRHQRVAAIYIAASLASLPIAYLLLKAWGVNGAAVALMGLESLMLVVILRRSLPAAHDTLRGWAESMLRPPVPSRAFGVLRALLRGS